MRLLRGRRFVVPAFALAIASTPVAAQDWATKALCNPVEIAVFDEAFVPLTATDIAEQAEEFANGTGRLWRIAAPGGAVSHIWGTTHSSHPAVLALPDLTEALIKKARVVALEIDPVAPTRAALAASRASRDWYRNGREGVPLDDGTIAPDVLAWIRARTQALGWGSSAPETLTAGALAELLLADPCDDFSAGVLPVQDGRIQMLALIAGAEILALEDTRRIKAYLDRPTNAPFARDFLAVYGSYFNPANTWRDRATSIALYRAGRIGELMALDRATISDTLQDGGGAYRTVNAYILDDRNAAFVSALRAPLATGGVFVAVGTFHLPGEQGMIELLRADGFLVTRVPLPGEAP